MLRREMLIPRDVLQHKTLIYNCFYARQIWICSISLWVNGEVNIVVLPGIDFGNFTCGKFNLMMNEQEVILVNEVDEAIGTMEKMEAHRKAVLHRAFSVFIFNTKGEMLLQRRAEGKYHSPGLWTNACCSHPLPGEDTHAAAERRLYEELGFKTVLKELFSFTYRTDFDNGLTEHEFDHVFTGVYDNKIVPDKNEVMDHKYLSLEMIERDIENRPEIFTSWFRIAFPIVQLRFRG